MMIDTPCARSQCPEMPKGSLDQAVVDLMESIALQETALSHILCAESRKMQAFEAFYPQLTALSKARLTQNKAGVSSVISGVMQALGLDAQGVVCAVKEVLA